LGGNNWAKPGGRERARVEGFNYFGIFALVRSNRPRPILPVNQLASQRQLAS
jgi:hypothetical protein